MILVVAGGQDCCGLLRGLQKIKKTKEKRREEKKKRKEKKTSEIEKKKIRNVVRQSRKIELKNNLK